MILAFAPGTSEQTLERLVERAALEGVRAATARRGAHAAIALFDKPTAALEAALDETPDLLERYTPPGAWRRADRAFAGGPTTVRIGGVEIGGSRPAVIAGPCSVEGARFMEDVARSVADAGADILRGGAYKPRTTPYSFQGLGREGLRQLTAAGHAAGLPVVTEIVDPRDLDAFVAAGVDALQIGARNAQNFKLLEHVAGAGRPVLLKRGMSATVEEWLCAAEYLLEHGCEDVVLCERGIRTFETATRNTLDLAVVPLLARWTHLPVVIDPSHATGRAELVAPMCRAAIACGAHGLAVEVHPDPRQARSDGPQALLPGELAKIVSDARVLASLGVH